MTSTSTPSTTSAPLQLFPSPSSHLPRKSSLKKPRLATGSPAPLKGVALQVTTSIPPANVANSSSPANYNYTPTHREPANSRQHARKRSSAPNLLASPARNEPLVHEDQLCPLPVNSSFTQSSPPRIRTPVARLKRPSIPKSISTHVGLRNEVTEMIDDDQLSPLPTKLSFKQSSQARCEYPSPVSFQSDGSTLVRSNSDATGRSPSSAISNAPARSIFPQYDHTRSLSQQKYFPRIQTNVTSPAPSNLSRTDSPVSWPSLKREDSAVALSNAYENIPKASAADILTIWHASNTSCPPTGRKVQLDIQQPAGHGMSLTLGANGSALYTMQTSTTSPTSSSEEEPTTHLTISKTCPSTSHQTPISQLSLPPNPTTPKPSPTSPPTTLFPHQAALDAIQTALHTPLASAIAATDPTASSPAAARLAQNAVSQAHRQHTSTLRRTARNRAAGTATYTLGHSGLGNLAITVSPSLSGSGSGQHKAVIALHHPRATAAAIESATLALLVLDFGLGTAVLDLPGLLALDELYLVDLAVGAVCAVTVLENEVCVREMVEFEGPPRDAAVAEGRDVVEGGLGGRRKGDRKEGRKEGKKAKKAERRAREREEGRERGLVRETLGLVGLGIRGAVWLGRNGLRVARESARPPPELR